MRKALLLCTLAALIPAAALAQGSITTAAGPRIGVSSDPDQFVVGGQLEMGEMAPDLTFIPNLELGFGDNVTTIQLNGDFHYHFTISGSAWRPYVGGGLGVAFYEWDNNGPGDSSDTEFGLNVIAGSIVPTKGGNRFFVELKLATSDLPSLKALVGWNFGM